MAFKRRGFPKKKAALVEGGLPQAAGNKYGVSPKEERTWNGTLYASKLEMRFHKALLEHFREDQIHLQVPFVLQEGFRMPFDKEMRRPIRYISDFVIGEKPDGNIIHPGSLVIDSKGFRTPEFNILRKLFEHTTGHPLWMLKNVKSLLQYIPIFKAMQEINRPLIKTLTDGPFIITGYISSDGTVSHKLLRIVGREGYLQLVRDSLEQLPEAFQCLISSNFNRFGLTKESFTEEQIQLGAASLEDSLRKKLEDKPADNEGASQITPAIGLFENKADHLIVLRMELIQETIVAQGAEEKNKKASASAFKAILEEQLPISRYLHRINLYPGKYTDVQPA